MKIVSWFSCGTVSAVATKLLLAKNDGRFEIDIVRIHIDEEHDDNERFASDCEKWFGQPIRVIRSDKFANCFDVWKRKRFLASPKGAPCTTALKRDVRKAYEAEHKPHMQAFGFTLEEAGRAERFRLDHSEIGLLTPLIGAGMTKNDCHAAIVRTGIELPAMYKLGFNNNNCIGCVKAGSPSYWARVRAHFPDRFKEMAELSRSLNSRLIKGTTGKRERFFLDELPVETPFSANEPNIDCSILCVMHESSLGADQ